MRAQKQILFLCQRIPYPPDKGDKIRSYRVLEHLLSRGDVHLGFFVDDENDWQHIDHLESICTSVFAVGLNPMWARLRSGQALASGNPLSQSYFHDRKLKSWVDELLASDRFDTAVIFSSAMAQYVAHHPSCPSKLIVDFVDVDSDKWLQYAASTSGLSRWIYSREAKTLLAFDREIGKLADACSFVSEQEAALFRTLAPELAETTVTISNGIDVDFFSPDLMKTSLVPDSYGRGPNLVMTGHMAYWPNVDAAMWFAAEILPLVQQHRPNARFHIVGSSPTSKLEKLGQRNDIHVSGRVDDVRPYLQHSSLIVAPMRIARGIQNKVLEGMAMGKCVVTTSQGLEGIDAEPGQHLLLADDAHHFAKTIVQALKDAHTARIGARAREHVAASYNWAARMSGFDPYL